MKWLRWVISVRNYWKLEIVKLKIGNNTYTNMGYFKTRLWRTTVNLKSILNNGELKYVCTS